MIPLYGFLEGDTMGLLILAYESDTIAMLAEKIQKSASVRVPPYSAYNVIYKEQILPPHLLLSEVNIKPLERFDVRRMENFNGI